MTISDELNYRLGGVWTWNGSDSWFCDDDTRWIYREVVEGITVYWLHGEGTPRSIVLSMYQKEG
jgi:hypothetical protein